MIGTPQFVLDLFTDGTLKVDSDGAVWRCRTRRGLRPGAPSIATSPTRIDRHTEIGSGRRIILRHEGKVVSIGLAKIKRIVRMLNRQGK